MAMRVHASLALGVTAAVLALAGCGGGSGHSFTIKVDSSGDDAYLVVDTAIPQRAVDQVLLQNLDNSGIAFVTSNKPTVALDCSRKTRDLGILPGPLHPYSGKVISVQIYGTGVLADGICANGLQSLGLGG